MAYSGTFRGRVFAGPLQMSGYSYDLLISKRARNDEADPMHNLPYLSASCPTRHVSLATKGNQPKLGRSSPLLGWTFALSQVSVRIHHTPIAYEDYNAVSLEPNH